MVETTFITLLLFHDWNVKVYQQEESLQIQRESDFRCFLFLPHAELPALWGSVWNCRIGDNGRRRGPPPGAFTANTFKQPQSRLKHSRVARLRSRLQKYETLSPSLTNHFHGLKIPGARFKNKGGNVSRVAARRRRWASSTRLSRWGFL